MSRALIALDPAPISAPRRPLDIGSYDFGIDDGVICCGSDQHYRPDEPASTPHRAFVQMVSRFAEEGSLRAIGRVSFRGELINVNGRRLH